MSVSLKFVQKVYCKKCHFHNQWQLLKTALLGCSGIGAFLPSDHTVSAPEFQSIIIRWNILNKGILRRFHDDGMVENKKELFAPISLLSSAPSSNPYLKIIESFRRRRNPQSVFFSPLGWWEILIGSRTSHLIFRSSSTLGNFCADSLLKVAFISFPKDLIVWQVGWVGY